MIRLENPEHPDELMEKYKLTSDEIIKKVKIILNSGVSING